MHLVLPIHISRCKRAKTVVCQNFPAADDIDFDLLENVFSCRYTNRTSRQNPITGEFEKIKQTKTFLDETPLLRRRVNYRPSSSKYVCCFWREIRPILPNLVTLSLTDWIMAPILRHGLWHLPFGGLINLPLTCGRTQ